MMPWLQRGIDAFRGRGNAALTVPPMDGALRTNTLLETADVLFRIDEPDSLLLHGDEVLFSSGCGVFVLDPASGAARELRRFDHRVSCLATGAGGLDDGGIRLWGADRDDRIIASLGGERLVCPTALMFRDPSTLVVCQGSSRNGPDRWKHDLMGREATGSVWQMSVADGSARMLAGRLGFPYGATMSEGEIVVSESWRHRLIRLSDGGAAPVLADLPGYPARLSASRHGGYWLCVPAPRSQLIDFVLGETAYRERMMRELDQEHWIAPTLARREVSWSRCRAARSGRTASRSHGRPRTRTGC